MGLVFRDGLMNNRWGDMECGMGWGTRVTSLTCC